MNLLKNRKRANAPVLSPFAGNSLDKVRDLRGFDLGVISARRAGDATVGVNVVDAAASSVTSCTRWAKHVETEPSIIATCCSWGLSPNDRTLTLWATFHAGTSALRKDSTAFDSEVARLAPTVYDVADEVGLLCDPLDDHEMTYLVRNLVGDAADTEFPPRGVQVEETSRSVLMADLEHVVFEVHGVEDESLTLLIDSVQRVLDAWDPVLTARIALWCRPAASVGAPARRSVTFALSATDTGACALATAELFAILPAEQRLRVRRLWNRQLVGVATAHGLGVLGWKHFEVLA